MKRLFVIVAVLCAACGSDHEATPRPSSSVSARTYTASTRPTPSTPEAPSSVSDGDDGHGTGNRAPVPRGVSARQWRQNWRAAGDVASNYWQARQRWDKPYGAWMKTTRKYSTSAMAAADRDYLNSYEFHKTARQMDSEGMSCTGNAWPEQSWVTDKEPATGDQLTLALPARQECVWGSSEDVSKRRRLYDTSPGRDGYNVEIVAFRMKKVGGKWKVDAWGHIDLPQGADAD